MNEELSKDEAVPETESGEEHVTPPQPKAPAQWSMPEPVFQQTSGILPQGFLKQIEDERAIQGGDMLEIPAMQSAAPQAAPDQIRDEPVLEMGEAREASPEVPSVSTPAAIDVEAQPDLPDHIAAEPVAVPAVAVKAKSDALRIILTVLGILGMLVVLIAFLIFVYLYFIARPGEVNNF